MRTLNEQIQRLRDVLVTCYNAIKRKGGTIPEEGLRNMSNLPAAVLSIPQSHGVLTELTVTSNGEYLPEEGVDGFSKVTAQFDTSSLPKVKVATFKVSNDCINEDGRWEGEDFIDTSECITCTDSFLNCSEIKRIDVDLETSKCTSFYRTFNGCNSLQYINTSNWNTSRVTNMQEMFINCSSLVEIDAKKWNVQNLTTSYAMFSNCQKLQSIIGSTTLEEVLRDNVACLNGYKVTTPAGIQNTALNTASILALVNGLADITSQTAQTLTLGSTIGTRLDTEQIAGVPAKEYLAGIANNKNWTIAY